MQRQRPDFTSSRTDPLPQPPQETPHRQQPDDTLYNYYRQPSYLRRGNHRGDHYPLQRTVSGPRSSHPPTYNQHSNQNLQQNNSYVWGTDELVVRLNNNSNNNNNNNSSSSNFYSGQFQRADRNLDYVRNSYYPNYQQGQGQGQGQGLARQGHSLPSQQQLQAGSHDYRRMQDNSYRLGHNHHEWNSGNLSSLNYLSSNHSGDLITYKEPDLWLMNSGQIIPPPPPPPPRNNQNLAANGNCSSKFVDSIRKIGLELESVSLSRQNSGDPSVANDNSTGQDEDRPSCIVCCEDLHQIAVGQCNHTLLCITCAVRMRTFYRNQQCPLCKAENPEIICTNWKTSVRPFNELCKTVQFEGIEGLPYIKLDMSLSKKSQRGISIRDKLNRLGSRSCPSCKQFTEFGAFKELSMHLMSQHGQYYCFVCQKAKRQFTTELDLFDRETLQSHLDTHPKCEFCNGLRYFSSREQKAHYQEEHYQCHICERMGLADMWLEDVDDLLNHMRVNHFTCRHCGDTVGFSTQEELNNHQEAMHNASSSHFNVGVDPGRNELRIQLRGGREENIDQVRNNLVMLLNYFREMFGAGEHNGFMHSIEDVMQQFQMQVGMDDWGNLEGGNRLRVVIPPSPPVPDRGIMEQLRLRGLEDVNNNNNINNNNISSNNNNSNSSNININLNNSPQGQIDENEGEDESD